MKYKWIKKVNSDKLILFFNGWGMDDYIVSELECGDYDVVVFYDYTDLDFDTDIAAAIESYSEKHVAAWSMGVMAAGQKVLEGLTLNSKSYTAICGTPYPINDIYGIPERIYNLTIKGFSETSVKKFMERMFIEPYTVKKFSDRNIDSQKRELIKMLDYRPDNNIKYTKAIVADSDVIIPTKNQITYWQTQNTNIETIHSGHCPFKKYQSWNEILKV